MWQYLTNSGLYKLQLRYKVYSLMSVAVSWSSSYTLLYLAVSYMSIGAQCTQWMYIIPSTHSLITTREFRLHMRVMIILRKKKGMTYKDGVTFLF